LVGVSTFVLLTAGWVHAADRYWVGGSGDWFDPANWSATAGGPGGAGVPAAGQNVYLTPSDAVDRTVSYAGPLEAAPKFSFTGLENTGGGSITLRVSGGQFSTNLLTIGGHGPAAVVQTGGSMSGDVYMGGASDAAPGSGEVLYDLQDGTLTVPAP